MIPTETFTPDAGDGFDWIKRSWELPPYKSEEFFLVVPRTELDSFRRTAVYRNAVVQRRIIHDIWVTPITKGDYAALLRKYSEDQARDEHGRWTSGGMGAALYSPNESPDTQTFVTASAQLVTDRYRAFVDQARAIDTQIGLKATTVPAIGDTSKWGTEQSAFTRASAPDPQTLLASAAIKGYLANQLNVGVFQQVANGDDRMYEFDIRAPVEEIRGELDKRGIEYRTFVPQGDSTRVVMIDQGAKQFNAAHDLAEHYQTPFNSYIGRASFIGNQQEGGSDEERRANAKAEYARIIEQVGAKNAAVRDIWRRFHPERFGKFDEAEPRDERGRWTTGGGGTAIAFDKEAKKWTQADGSPLTTDDATRVAAAKPSPGWHDIRLSPDPKDRLQIIAKDSKDRWQRRYSAEHSEAAAAEKFARLKDFNDALPGIRDKIAADLTTNDVPPGHADAALTLAIIDKTGSRVGGEEDTGAKIKAYGISTLEGQHVTVDGDTVRLSFAGKSGKLNKAEFTDATIAGALRERTLTAGQRIVNTDDAAIRDYLHRISGDDFKTKDFRTWHGTSTALTALQGRAQPQGEKEFTKMQRDVAKAVAAHLGNTPAVALKYYIDPAVWQKWTP